MTETQVDPIEMAIQESIAAINIPSSGHVDENGKLKQQYQRDEIANKIASTYGFAREVGRDDLAEASLAALREAYPDQQKIIEEIITRYNND